MSFAAQGQQAAEVEFSRLGEPSVYTPADGPSVSVCALLHYQSADTQGTGAAARETRLRCSVLRSLVPVVKRGDLLGVLDSDGAQTVALYVVDAQESFDDHVTRFWMRRSDKAA